MDEQHTGTTSEEKRDMMNHRHTNEKQGRSWPSVAAEQHPIAGPNPGRLSRTLPALEQVAGYLSIREAARMLGVSERSVYGYLQSGKLAGGKIGDLIVVSAEALADFERRASGRIRRTTPRWHIPRNAISTSS